MADTVSVAERRPLCNAQFCMAAVRHPPSGCHFLIWLLVYSKDRVTLHEAIEGAEMQDNFSL